MSNSNILYKKRNSYNFNIVRFLYKNSTIPLKMFLATISAEILQICTATFAVATFAVAQFIKTYHIFLHQILSFLSLRSINFMIIS